MRRLKREGVSNGKVVNDGVFSAGLCIFVFQRWRIFTLLCIRLGVTWRLSEVWVSRLAITICSYGILCRASTGTVPSPATGSSVYGQCGRIASFVLGY
jgi:hypothetical protein